MAEGGAAVDAFADDARQALALAQQEANTYRQRLVGTEHILLGLLRTEGGLAAQTLASFNINEQRMREAIDLLAGRGTARHASDRTELNLTQRTQEAFELAGRLQRAFGHDAIHTEHILLALIEIPGNAALGVLQALGVEREYIRDRTFTFMRQPNPLPEQTAPQLTHLDNRGQAHMVDVGAKDNTAREAIARGRIVMQPATLQQIVAGDLPKGDVLAVARIAGIMAAKQTSAVIPLCHPLMLTHVSVELTPNDADHGVEIEATVRTTGKTGVEMEALTAVSIAALTIYDMCKAIDRGMRITDIRLAEKRGGKSGEIVLE